MGLGGSNPIRSGRGSGFLGALIRIRQTLKNITLNKLSCSLHTFLSTLKVNSWRWHQRNTYKTRHDCDAHVWSLLLMEEILHQLIGSLSHSFQSFRHPRWCRISSINSSTGIRVALKTPFGSQNSPVGAMKLQNAWPHDVAIISHDGCMSGRFTSIYHLLPKKIYKNSTKCR